jgi:N-glycosylase/DNA lyase
MDESAYSTLLKYVENTEYNENLTESEKRKIRKQAKHYVSKDNLLYYVSAKGETRRVVREAEKHRILRACHSDSTAGKYIFYVF